MIRPNPGLHVLGISAVRGRRETDQITEQDRDDLALLLHVGSRLLDQGRRAEATELEALRVLPTAAWADRHTARLRDRTAQEKSKSGSRALPAPSQAEPFLHQATHPRTEED